MPTRESWGRVDTAGPFVEIAWQAAFSTAEFDRIRQGAIPDEMEDRWFSFFEEPNLFLLRSWTGYCIYRVTFTHRAGDVVVQQAVVSANINHYARSSDDYEVAFLEFLVHQLLLGESWPVPDGPPDEPSPQPRSILAWLGERLRAVLRSRLRQQ